MACCRRPFAAEQILAFIESTTPPEELARIRFEAMLDFVDMIARENAARLAKLPPRLRHLRNVKFEAIALVAHGLLEDAYLHLLAAGAAPATARRFVACWARNRHLLGPLAD